MSRSDGFPVMDVSTSICDDPKFRLLQRRNPGIVAVAFTAYIATVAESWRSGRRVTIDHAWPAFLAFDEAVQFALTDVGLLDRAGMIPAKAWRGWFDPANERRTQSRVRWARYNAKRNADTASLPRGDDADTATSDPSVPPVPPGSSVPPVRPPRAPRGKKDDGLTTQPTKERALFELSEKYQRGELSEMDYERQRRALTA